MLHKFKHRCGSAVEQEVHTNEAIKMSPDAQHIRIPDEMVSIWNKLSRVRKTCFAINLE